MWRFVRKRVRKFIKMNLFFKIIYILSFILLFFPALSIPLGKPVSIFFIVTTLFFILYNLFFAKKFIKILFFAYKKTPFKYFVYWFSWIVISGLILVLLNKYTIGHYIYYLVLFLIINMTLPLLLPIITITKRLHLQKFIKFYCIMSIIIFSLGMLNFIGSIFEISLVKNLFNMVVVNSRSLSGGLGTVAMYGNRVYSVFAEPGWFAGWICLNLPIFYYLSKKENKIFEQSFLNKLIKILLIPMAWLCLVLTQSPIWLIFSLIVTFVMYFKNLVFYIKKQFIAIITGIIITGVILIITSNYIDLKEKYLVRIFNVFLIKDIIDFIHIEASLSNRLLCYYHSILVFIKYPLLGIGLGNAKYYIASFFETSNLPLTPEIYAYLDIYYLTGKMNYNGAFFYDLLAETGIFSFLLFYFFIYKLRVVLNKNLKFINSKTIQNFAKGIRFSLLIFIPLSLYDICFPFVHIWFLFGLAITILCLVKKEEIKGVLYK